MNLFYKFAKTLTGQNRKTQLIEGKNVEFLYSGKFISVNPFSLVRDMKFRLQAELDGGAFKTSLASNVSFQSILPDGKEDLYTLVAQTKMKCGIFKVCRSVESGARYPISRYDLLLGDEPLCTMIRKYDYGAEFVKTSKKLIDTFGQPGLSFENRNSWKIDGTEMLILEKFGHTHLYRFLDLEGFQELEGEISKEIELSSGNIDV